MGAGYMGTTELSTFFEASAGTFVPVGIGVRPSYIGGGIGLPFCGCRMA